MKSSDKEFLAEAEEIIDEALSILIEIQDSLQVGVQPDSVNSLFRAMHTLKGMSGLFGYQHMSDISHSLESILDLIRLGRAELNENVVSFLFRNFDFLKSMLEGLKSKKPVAPDKAARCISEIGEFTRSLKEADKGQSTAELQGYGDLLGVLSEYEEHRLKTNLRTGNGLYILKAAFSLDTFDTLLKDLTEKIKPTGELISTMPTSEGVEPGNIGFKLIVGAACEPEELKRLTGYDPEVMSPLKKAAPAPAAAPASTAQGALADHDPSLRTTSTTTVRVDITKLDTILNSLGELNNIKYSLFRTWAELSDALGNMPLVLELYKTAQGMDRRLGELQGQVLEIRMIPLGQIFARLGQITKRYSRGARKTINMEFYGEDTEVDKFIAEEIVDPLMHIVRNAIDHGLESTEERRKSGKPEAGTLKLRAYQRGNNVILEVQDDGGGIDGMKVYQKALDMGVINEDVVLDDREIVNLIFMPGFSTADKVSETSGRGVGLDVVREKLAELGGQVEVESSLKKGTTFRLTLPITLAIVKSLLVGMAGESYAIPLTSMSETFIIEDREIQVMEGRRVHNLRGQVLPLVPLADLLGLAGYEATGRHSVVVVGHGERKLGLMLDTLGVQQDIVIKPLGEYFDEIEGYAGAAEVGANKVILVLDVEALISNAFNDINVRAVKA